MFFSMFRPRHDDEEPELFAQKKLSFFRRFMNGFKLYITLLLASPFLVFFIPMWFFYRWNEQRHGRPAPPAPWAQLFPKRPFVWLRYEEGTPASSPPAASKQNLSAPLPLLAAGGQRGTAVVTGGARRMGALICRELARLGYHVAVAYGDASMEAVDLVAELRGMGVQAADFSVELRNPQAIEQLLMDVEEALGPVTLLINNAAIMAPTRLADCTWEGLENLMRVNLLAPFWLTICAQRRMAAGGLVINMSDIWGERPLRGHAAYSTSKAGLIMATRALAREMAPHIRVNAIAPGAVLAREDQEGDGYNLMLRLTPLAEHAGPEAVLQAIRYLIGAPFVTGEVLHVDGGRMWGG